ncbi:family 2 glycosyl transferase, partial [Streptomyces sp. NPDC059590]
GGGGGRRGPPGRAVVGPVWPAAGAAARGWGAGAGARDGERPSWRATWAYALLLTFTMAFTPIVWPIALLLGLGVLALRFAESRTEQLTAYGLRFLAVVLTPLAVLAPWSADLLTDPGRFLDEAGLGYTTGSASALDLLALSPGGPKAGGTLLLLGFVLAALAALMRGERQLAVRTAWAVALTGFLFAALTNGSGWAGPATLVYGLALLSAGVVGAEGARQRVAAQSFGWRQPVALLIAAAAAAAPLWAAAAWMLSGADGPVVRRAPDQVPAFVAAESSTRDQARTLVLDGNGAQADYVLVRGSGARLGDAELTGAAGGDRRLDRVVANLIAGSGADQTGQLGGYAIRYVVVREGSARQMSRVLDATPGLTRLSQEDGSALWRVDQRISRVTIVPGAQAGETAETGGQGGSTAGSQAAPVNVPSGPVEAHTTVPAGPAGRVLRIADRATEGWQATLDGKPLKAKTVDGWAQGFELPANGGRLDLSYESPVTHTAWMWAQGLLALVLVVLALPGRRRTVDDDLPEAEAAAVAAEDLTGDGRRARRLRAAAEAAAQTALDAPEAGAPAARTTDTPAPEAPGAPPAPPEGTDAGQEAAAAADPYAAVPPQQQYGEWDAQPYAGAGGAGYGGQQGDQYQGDQYQGGDYSGAGYQSGEYQGTGYQQGGEYQAGDYSAAGYQGDQYGQGQYAQGQYAQGQYPADPYASGQYADPYAYDQQQPYADGGTYPQQQGDTTYGDAEPEARRDGSEQQR